MCKKIFFFVLALCFWGSAVVFAKPGEVTEKVSEFKEKKARLVEELKEDELKDKFETELWVSLMHVAGNTDSLSVSTRNMLLWRKGAFESNWKLGANYFRVYESNSLTVGTQAKYVFGTYRLDYYFNPRTTLYVGGGGYTDRVTGVDAAGQAFTGFTYMIIKQPKMNLRGSLGYDYAYEDRVSPNANVSVHSVAWALDYNYFFNDHVTFFDNLSVQQNVVTAPDFRLQNQLGVKSKLTKYFSIMASHSLRFDNQPVSGFGKVDSITDVALGLVF